MPFPTSGEILRFRVGILRSPESGEIAGKEVTGGPLEGPELG